MATGDEGNAVKLIVENEIMELWLTIFMIGFQNIFPLAKVSFAKGKMLGAGRHPTGPE